MAVNKPAILYLEKITCNATTGESGDDDIGLIIEVDGNKQYEPSRHSGWHIKKGGGTQYVNIEINVTYANKVKITLVERDGKDVDMEASKNEIIGSHTIERGQVNTDHSQTVDMDLVSSGSEVDASTDYTMTYRIITDPIPTARILGIRCEQQSAGMNVDLVSAVAGVASEACDAAAKVVKKSPRPRAKAMSGAFKAASKVLQTVEDLAEFIGKIIEGGDDEVYMKQVETTRGHNGAFFPPDPAEYYRMKKDMDVCFEDTYGFYFRMPLDEGPVTVKFRELDSIKADISLGELTIAPDNLNWDTSNGISSTFNGGVAVLDGPAVIELADGYHENERGGEGALYHICYSIGFENWCKPASWHGQHVGSYHAIQSCQSGQNCDVPGSSDGSGKHLEMYSPHYGANQLFLLEDAGNGKFTFKVKHNGYYLLADEGPGGFLKQWSGSGTHFTIEEQDEGGVQIKTSNNEPLKISPQSGGPTKIEIGHVGETGPETIWDLVIQN